MPVGQYGAAAEARTFPSFSAMFDNFFGARERMAAMRSRMHDMETLLSSVKNKLSRKLPQLQKELKACEEMDTFKLWGDLITASVYMLNKKAAFCEVTNYYSENLETVRIPLDNKLMPSQNAARYYKKYTKLKTARSILTEQIEKALEELNYLDSVEEAMARVENEEDILGIRAELMHSGYISKNPTAAKQKDKPEKGIRRCRTTLGREFFVGKNNMQNDYLTTKLAKRSDWWFHVKGGHGSHVIMVCDIGEDPDARDFTEAAAAAAYYSGFRDGENVAVDYTEVRNVKKPSGSVPGKVVYYTNYTAYVNPAKPTEA
jgi:predicted ribosome quality control (RQC) complex YloA/Tae2 family protein